MAAHDKISEFGGTFPLKNIYAQTKKHYLKIIILSSKRGPNLFEAEPGKKFSNRLFTNLFENHDVKKCSRKTSLGVVFFAEKFDKTKASGDRKNPVCRKGDGTWIDVPLTIAKHYNERIHSSSTTILNEAS